MEVAGPEYDNFKPGNKELVKEAGVRKDGIKEQSFEKGSVIFGQGNRPDFMIYINSGTVKIYKKGKNNESRLVHILHDGNFYGILAILMNNPYNATALASSDCRLTLISPASFDSFVLKNPEIGLKMIKFLAFKLTSTNIEIKLWPKQQFDKFLVVHIEDDLVVQKKLQKLFEGKEFRLNQYFSVGELKDDMITLVKLARKYQGFFVVADGELQDGTFCDVFVALENIVRLNRSVVSILTGKVDSSEKALELVEKFNTTHITPDIVISKVDAAKAGKIDSLLKEIFYNKYHEAEQPHLR